MSEKREREGKEGGKEEGRGEGRGIQWKMREMKEMKEERRNLEYEDGEREN